MFTFNTNTAITKCSKSNSFSPRTSVPRVTSPTWKIGVPTLVNDGTLSPNQEAITLLFGFASGKIKMAGDVVQHLLTNNPIWLPLIRESLQELDRESPTP